MNYFKIHYVLKFKNFSKSVAESHRTFFSKKKSTLQISFV